MQHYRYVRYVRNRGSAAPELPAELERLAEAWPRLAEHIRLAILSLAGVK